MCWLLWQHKNKDFKYSWIWICGLWYEKYETVTMFTYYIKLREEENFIFFDMEALRYDTLLHHTID